MNITLQDVYDFYKQYPEHKGELKVLSRFGYKKIEECEITSKDSIIIRIETESGKYLEGSPDHKLLTKNNKWKKIKELKIGDYLFSQDDIETITKISLLDYKEDLLDIQVEEVSEYYANDIVSHNSTIPIDVLWFALFGKAYRKVNLDMLINSINKKELETYIKMRVRGDAYRVERGIKPNYFRIYKNDVLIPVDSQKKNYQKMFEDILCFNEGIADQVMVKSMTRNVSFLTLTKAQKREIVEGIFGLESFSELNEKCKSRNDKNEKKITESRMRTESFDRLYQQEVDTIRRLKEANEQIQSNIDKKKKELTERIQVLTTENVKYQEGLVRLSKLKEEKTTINEALVLLNKGLGEKESEFRAVTSLISGERKTIEFLREKCPTCHKIKELEEANSLEINEQKKTELETIIAGVKSVKAGHDERINKINQLLANESMVNSNLTKNKAEIVKLEAMMAEEDGQLIEINEDGLLKIKTEKKEEETNYNTFMKTKKNLAIMKNLLSDEGIKAYMVNRHLPSINALVNSYLKKFQIELSFNFDSECNEVIKSRHKENFNYFSFSEGQKRRIDLAILFAFTEFSKLRNARSTSNLMVLDEITAGCDSIAENALYDIIKEMSVKENKEIITISHSMAIDVDKVDRLFETSIEKGFSQIKEIQS